MMILESDSSNQSINILKQFKLKQFIVVFLALFMNALIYFTEKNILYKNLNVSFSLTYQITIFMVYFSIVFIPLIDILNDTVRQPIADILYVIIFLSGFLAIVLESKILVKKILTAIFFFSIILLYCIILYGMTRKFYIYSIIVEFLIFIFCLVVYFMPKKSLIKHIKVYNIVLYTILALFILSEICYLFITR